MSEAPGRRLDGLCRSRLCKAAILAWLGDLDEAERLLRAMGRSVHRHEHGRTISWPAEDGRPGGGITTGGDPVSNIIVLLFAVVGPLWPLVDEAKQVFDETKRAWQALSRQREGG